METNNETVILTPPKLIPSLITGFNSIANHIAIIVFPIILDLFLWFGPKISLKELLLPSINSFIEFLKSQNSTEMANIYSYAEETFEILMERFNLAVSLRTYPIGVPSLLSAESPLLTPLGSPQRYELLTVSSAFLIWGVFSLVGMIFGCVFFYEIARLNNIIMPKINITRLLRSFIQMFLFTLFLVVLLLIFSIPLSFILSIFSLLHPVVAQLAALILSLIIMWLFLPLIFTPHGIFAKDSNFINSILVSTRLVRMTLPGTGFFILVLILLSQGMDVLWRIPPETSWLKLIGIAGHAFISSSVISASFAYYTDGIQWVDNYINAIKQRTDLKI